MPPQARDEQLINQAKSCIKGGQVKV